VTLRSFIDDVGPPTQVIAVLNDDATGPLEQLLVEAFEDQPIDVETDPPSDVADTIEAEGDTAVLLEDGRPVAASPTIALYDALLAINSDLFVTGGRTVGEIELPDVLANLEDTRLRLRGYPLAHKEKLLLIVVSRYIEQRAWETGRGTLRSAFQRLSRIDDELGTYEVYDELGATDVDVHVYGVDDGATLDLDATVHAGTDPPYRRAWFVVFVPDDPADGDAIGLLCLEVEPRVWDGFWTTDPERVAAIEAHVRREL
jgi:hypothetical protein